MILKSLTFVQYCDQRKTCVGYTNSKHGHGQQQGQLNRKRSSLVFRPRLRLSVHWSKSLRIRHIQTIRLRSVFILHGIQFAK